MHVQGQNRSQATLFPERLEELIAEDNAVRVIDAFVDSLDLKALGFARIEVKATGRPPYHPGDLLKLYQFGYMHRVRSSRRLERECHTNLDASGRVTTPLPAAVSNTYSGLSALTRFVRSSA
jgi:transposase